MLKACPVSSCGLEFCTWVTVKYCMMYSETGVLTSRIFGEALKLLLRADTYLLLFNFVMRLESSVQIIKICYARFYFWLMSFLFWWCYPLCFSILCLLDTDLFKSLFFLNFWKKTNCNSNSFISLCYLYTRRLQLVDGIIYLISLACPV